MDSLVSTSKPGPLRDKLGHFCSANPAQTILPPDGAGGVDYLLPLNSRQSRELSRVCGRAKDLIAALGGTAAGKPDHKNGDDRLWATRHGVIDGFETLSQIVLRVLGIYIYKRSDDKKAQGASSIFDKLP